MPQLSSDQIGAALGLPPPTPTDYIAVPPPGATTPSGSAAPDLVNTAVPSPDPSVAINETSAPPLSDKEFAQARHWPETEEEWRARTGGNRPEGAGKGVTIPSIEKPGGGPPVVVKPSRGRDALDSIMGGVWGVESGNEHLDKDGKVKRNPSSGATGVSQLMPDTAKGLGVDPNDEAQNREGGKRYLATQYDKYGNWEDALAAYNWGPGNVDKWIASGRDPAKMPAETRAYIPAVLSSVGITEGPGERALAGKRKLTPDDISDVLSKPARAMTIDAPDEELSAARGFIAAEPPGQATDTIDAFGHGMRRGVQNLLLGPAQAALEKTAPGTAEELTRRVNEFEDQFQSTKEHPVIALGGEVVGTTIGLLAAGKLLGTTGAKAALEGVMPQFLARTGLITRSAAGGFALGATSWNPVPEEASRVLEGVMGGSAGALGATIAKGIVAGATKLASTNLYNDFLSSVKGSIEGFSPSINKLKDQFVERYAGVVAEKNERYAIRNAAGREIDGFDRATVGKPAQDAIEGSRGQGVAPTPTTRSVATKVDQELGGPEARAAEAEHTAAVKQFDKELKDWNRTYVTGLGNVPAAQRAQIIQQEVRRGNIPPPPEHPGDFEASLITSEQLSSALQSINRAWVGARRDPTTRFQLRQITRETLGAAEEAAQAAGMDINTFMRTATEAGKFHREQVVPLQKFVDFKTPKDVVGDPNVPFSGVSPAQFYDKVHTILKSNDKEGIESLAKIYSSRAAKDELVKVAAFDMMQELGKVQNPRRMPEALGKYMKDRIANLEVLVGREGVEKLTGVQKIAEQLIKEPTKYSQMHRLLASHGWLQAIGAVDVARGVLTGNVKEIGKGSAMIIGPWVGHHLYEVGSKMLGNPGLLPLVSRAAKQRPGSVELDRTLREIERRVVRQSQVIGRTVAPATDPLASFVPESPF